MYQARDKREAKRTACRIASFALEGDGMCWEIFDKFPDEKQFERYVAAMKELISELDRRGLESSER